MTRFLPVLLSSVVVLLCVHGSAHADTVYQWRDSNGVRHFSNRADAVPKHAREAELPPLGRIEIPRQRSRVPLTDERWPVIEFDGQNQVSACDPADPTALAHAVAGRLRNRGMLEGLTLIVDSEPVSYSRDAIVTVYKYDEDPYEPFGVVEQGAIAYPAGQPCPVRPPLPRYAVPAAGVGRSGDICEDFRRAFPHHGIAANRNQHVGWSFREIAAHYVAVAADGYAAREPEDTVHVSLATYEPTTTPRSSTPVALPPWLVEAHVAQTSELGQEADDLVTELAVALEEIDRAARNAGCW
jgi:hypothetical protein